MSDLVEDMGKALSLYHDGEDNLAHSCAMKCIRDHHATIQQNAEYAYHLREILAVINGDGGQYLAKHGVKDSSECAINKIAELIIECDKNAEDAKRLRALKRAIVRVSSQVTFHTMTNRACIEQFVSAVSGMTHSNDRPRRRSP